MNKTNNNVMIENPNPRNWRALQVGVCRLLNEIGLAAETGKIVDTPRGKVEIDVFAVDEKSVDKIKYIVECKNWAKPVPQAVVHSFTTVMHEVGANMGFIVSKRGLQVGATQYTQHTNITGLSYAEFQWRYFKVWYERCFVPKIGDAVGPLSEYVEPFNYHRDEKVKNLSASKRQKYFGLLKKYQPFGMTMAFFEFPRYSWHFSMVTEAPESIAKIKETIEASLSGTYRLKSTYFRDLQQEIVRLVEDVTNKFNSVFGENIFASKYSL
jgi:hypothetical protein